MNFTADYLKDAEKVIFRVLQEWRPRLMAAHGNAAFSMKADSSVVSDYDKGLEVALKAALGKFDGSVGFLGEEDGQAGNQSEFWLVDPIDGTESFVRGLPGCRNILTLVSNGQAQYALAYRFTTDDLFIARRGHGAFKNGQPIKVSQRPIDRAWIETSMTLLDPPVYRMFQAMRPRIAGISVMRDFLLIAEGHLDGYISYGTGGGVWDYAPRALIIEEAGGRVANVGSDVYSLDVTNLLASNGIIFDELQKCLSPTA